MRGAKASTRVLVIGGTGFVGRAVGRALGAAGVDAISASRRTGGVDEYARHMAIDRQDEGDLARLLKEIDPDVVVDLACYQPFELEAIMRTTGARRYIFASAQNVYLLNGRAPAEDDFVPLTGEVMARVADPLADGAAYTLGKQWCETLLLQSAGFPYVSLRLPAVFGRRDHTHRITAYMQRVDDGGPLLVPDETIDLPTILAWVDDIGRAVAAACDLGRDVDRQAFNLAYDNLTGVQFIETLGQAMGREVDLVRVPIAEIPPFAAAYGPHAQLPGSVVARAQAGLDFSPAPLREALDDCVAWFREERPESPLDTGRSAEVAQAASMKNKTKPL
ncbi:MAG: NAD-dependent epimerase/dehydratase family protein [Candidatus Dormibacteria bacterium]